MPEPIHTVRTLAVVRELHSRHSGWVTSALLAEALDVSLSTAKRRLEALVQAGKLRRTGRGRATRYLPAGPVLAVQDDATDVVTATDGGSASARVPLSAAARAVVQTLARPLGMRTPVTYQRTFVDAYQPNISFLLPPDLAQALQAEGRMPGQQPAGTYARKVLEQLLIDLSWSSSRLEGNTYTRLRTEQLFHDGVHGGDRDAVMLLNHKRAIEFMVDAVPQYGLTAALVRNLHALLMQDLLDDAASLGAIRRKIVNITDTVYLPTQMPSLLDEMFLAMLERARQVKNPVEAAFFLWLNIAYLQPFEDGNKCTSRLAANMPLLLYNCAPLSFLDVNPHDYAQAMLGVYELLDLSLATELFAWTYRRSISKYAVVLESMGKPDPFRLRNRELITAMVQRVVREGLSLSAALGAAPVAPNDREALGALLTAELAILDVHNCARHRLPQQAVEAWIRGGRRS